MPDFTAVTVTQTYEQAPGIPSTGYVDFQLSAVLANNSNWHVFSRAVFRCRLVDGVLTAPLIALDDSTTVPTGAVWTATEVIDDITRPAWSFSLSTAQAPTVALYSLAPAYPVIPMSPYATSAALAAEITRATTAEAALAGPAQFGVASINHYGGDPTGVADSTPAFLAAALALAGASTYPGLSFWSSATAYTAGQYVVRSTSIYQAVTGSTGQTPSFAATTAYWQWIGFCGTGTIQFGAGTYKIGNAQALGPGFSVNGAGMWSTVIMAQTTGHCLRFVAPDWNNITPTHYGSVATAKSQVYGGKVSNLTIDGSSAGAGASGIHAGDINDFVVEDVVVRMFQSQTGCSPWVSTVAYTSASVVTYEGQVYQGTASAGTNTPPTGTQANNTFWTWLSAVSIGVWFDTIYGEAERLQTRGLHCWYNQVAVQFDVNSGKFPLASVWNTSAFVYSANTPTFVGYSDGNIYQLLQNSTNNPPSSSPTFWSLVAAAPLTTASYDHSCLDIEIIALPNQDGVVVNNGALLFDCEKINITGNFLGGTPNTGSVLRLVGHSVNVSFITSGIASYSSIGHGQLNLEVEGNASGVGHQSITFTTTSRNFVRGFGNLSILGGLASSNYSSVNGGSGAWVYSGRIYGDTVLGGTSASNQEAAFSSAGPKTDLPWAMVFSGGNTLTANLPAADWFTATLAANITSIALSSPENQAREIKVVLTQAASGGPFTVTGWPASVTWSLANGSAAPTMPAGASAILIVTLRSADQSKWVGSY